MHLMEIHLARVFAQKQNLYSFKSCCVFICIIGSRTRSITLSEPASRQFLPNACSDLNPPQIKNPWLHNESKKVLESFQSAVEFLRMSWVLSAAHEIIQHFGQLSAKRIKDTAITRKCILNGCRWRVRRCVWGTGESRGVWGMARWELNVPSSNEAVTKVRGCTARIGILTGRPKSRWSVC